MPDNPNILFAHRIASEISEQNALVREIIAKSQDVLRTSAPDTFLGRKTQEPFREEKEGNDGTPQNDT